MRTPKWIFRTQLIAMAGIMAAFSACSSSETKNEGDEFGEPAPAAEASTDAVPQDSVEAPPAPTGDTAAIPAPPAEEPGDTPPGLAHSEEPVAPPPSSDVADAAPAPAPAAPVEEPKHEELSAAPVAPVAPAAPAVSSPVAMSDADSYTVQKGDTLMKVAFETYGDLFQWKKIFDQNRDQLKDPNHIPPGTVLKLEKGAKIEVARNGDKYLIKKGDTLGTISSDVYGTPRKWKRLWENNKQLIHDPNKIFAGFFLYYTMSPEDDQYKRTHEVKPAPLAHKSAPVAPAAQAAPPAEETRDPASVRPQPRQVAPAPVAPVQPAARPAPAAPVQQQQAPAAQPGESEKPASFWDRFKKWGK